LAPSPAKKAAAEQAERVRKVGGKAYTERVKTQQETASGSGDRSPRGEAAEQARNRLVRRMSKSRWLPTDAAGYVCADMSLPR
jgi:hypothetical protein